MNLYQISYDTLAHYSYFIEQAPTFAFERCCDNCWGILEPFDKPLVVKWNGGKDPGDFAWSLGATCVKESIAHDLCASFPELFLGEVTILNRHREEDKNKRHSYHGEDIVQIRSRLRVDLNADRCTLADDEHAYVPCPVCGRVIGRLEGIEMLPTEFSSPKNPAPNYMRRVPRREGKGVFLYADELKGCNFFMLGGSHHLFCTQEVKDFIRHEGYTNVDFAEVGCIIEPGTIFPIERKDLTHRAKVYASRPWLAAPISSYANYPNKRKSKRRRTNDQSRIPRLHIDDPTSCPVGLQEICAYVEVESASGDCEALSWLRSGRIDDDKLWVWEMDDDGTQTFVYVHEKNGRVSIGLNASNEMTFDEFFDREVKQNV